MSVKRERLTYTKEELFQLWRRFRENEDAIETLQAFAITNEETARKLHEEFLIRYEADYLNLERRGKYDE